MQEKVKEKREKMYTERQKASAVLRRSRLTGVGKGLLFGCAAFLLGQAELLFGTFPLGIAFLCAAGGNILPILAGLIASALMMTQDPIVYICTYCAAALIRAVTAMIVDNPDARFELPTGLRRLLCRQDKPTEQEPDGSGEDASHRAPMRTGFWAHLRQKNGWEGLIPLREAIPTVFTESVCLRMTSGAVCALIVAVYRLISGGFRYYDLFAALFAVLLTPAAVMVYSVWCGDQVRNPVLRAVSAGALLFSVVFAAGRVELSGLSLSATLALFFTLYIASERSYAVGIVASILCGLAYGPLYSPAFLLAALVFIPLQRRGQENAGTLSACLAVMVWSTYVGGVEMLLRMLPAALIAGTAFALLRKVGSARKKETVTEETAQAPGQNEPDGSARLRFADTRHRDANERFRGISDAFSGLSEMFYNLSDRFRRPGTLDLRRLCDNAFDAFCPDCPNKTVCWGLEYAQTLDTVNRLISQLHTRGKVSAGEIPQHLAHRCEAMPGILERINRDCARLTGEMLRNNRTEIFAMDYESAAKIINDALEEDDGEYRFDPELEQKVSEYLTDAGVRAQSVTVYGRRRRQLLVRGADIEHAAVTAETMRSDLGEMCGIELGNPVFEVEDGVSSMIFQAKKKISVVGAQNNVSADGGVSGDTVNLFSNRKDFFYALISDGMGAGKEAALTSNLCSVFLEKMLRAGNRAGTSLRMLNNLIRSRTSGSAAECSSTVDLTELDLMTGEAAFIKSGAAPSFVVRGTAVHRVQSGTAPIGIICKLDAQTTRFPLHVGDTVVQISDGILQNDPDCEWISSFLAEAGKRTPEEIVYQICLHAAAGEGHDDCSAVALRILNAEEKREASSVSGTPA